MAAAFFLATAGLAGQQPAATGSYSMSDLGTLGGASSEAFGVNIFGDVVGAWTTADGASHAFLYQNGRMIDLGTFPGGTTSAATAITDEGIVVGESGINAYGPGFREFTQGFVWQDGAMRPLGALYCPCSFNERYGTSRATAVNRLGRIVGDSRTNRQTFTHAFLWQENVMRDMGNAMNGASNSVGEGAGSAVGAGRVSRAFVWNAGGMRDLGTLPGDAASEARAINRFGEVVGESGNADLTSSRAVLWQNGIASDLNARIAPAGWILTRATSINDLGEIAGAPLIEGQPRAFLLTPQ